MLTPFDDYPIHPSADPIAHSGDRRPEPLRPLLVQRPPEGRRVLLRRRHGPLPGPRRDRRRLQPRARRRRALGVRVGPDAARPLDRRSARFASRSSSRCARSATSSSPTSTASRATSPSGPRPSPSRSRASDDRAPRGHPGDGPHPPHAVGHVGGHDHRRRPRAAHRPERRRPAPATARGACGRSVRSVRDQLAGAAMPQAFWLWAPLHFDDRYTHLALHEYSDGTPLARDVRSCSTRSPTARSRGARPGVARVPRHPLRARLRARPARDPTSRPVVRAPRPKARCTSSSRRCSPSACAASATAIRTGATAPTTVSSRPAASRSSSTTSTRSTSSSLHLQNLVIARMGDRTGVGVLEQAHFGPHTPTGLTGFLDGFSS